MTAVTSLWICHLESIRAVAGIQHVLWTLVEKWFSSPFCLLSIKLLIIIIKKDAKTYWVLLQTHTEI